MPKAKKHSWPLTRLAEAVLVIFILVVIMTSCLIWGFASGRIEQNGSRQTAQLAAEDFQVDLTLSGSLSEVGGVMLADLQVPESQLANMFDGKQVLISIPDAGGLEVYGTVSNISSEAQSAEGSADGPLLASGEPCYVATVTLGYNPASAKDGMEVVATVSVDELGEAFGIEPGALGDDSGNAYVAVVYENGSIKQTPVTVIGQTDDGRLIIQGSALSSGLTICTDLS